ncbi:EpsG family protein [Candidatus Pseudothioglobus singularis]|jgi:hypothetical protein|uniref:EpsG family protein n=1 Tax=Candidatus Pseudothioglobus singularis PS1 TaxID=1125411 RepID=A0A0M4M1W4_9GAMM|nr:EpsG family protein [Candidatus Pseudothioglobus singularis]ALE02762.1 hypothetical protein W908_06925 [Candidatus Pseudothioglobus singularis PS1]
MFFKDRPVFLFFLAYIIGLIVSLIWLSFGEAWQVFGDAVHYVSIYNGGLAPAPWGFRVMTPLIAKIFPWDLKTNFAIITINSLAFTTGILALYGRKIGFNLKEISIFILFWVISYPFAYYSSALIRADAPMLLILALIFMWSKYKASSILLLLTISIGTFFHEMILIVIPALWLDKIFSGKLTGGRQYSTFELLSVTIVPLVIMIFTRSYFVNVFIIAEEDLLTSSVLEYTGGGLKHILRIYATFGPAFLFFIFFIITTRKTSILIPAAGLLFITAFATLLAADTLRVMSILFVPILLYASKYLVTCMNHKHNDLKISFMLLLQVLYSYTVFGHLRTFEASMTMNIAAAIISIFTLLICLLTYKKNNIRDFLRS